MLFFQTRDEKCVEVIVQRPKSLRCHHLPVLALLHLLDRQVSEGLAAHAMQGAAGCNEASPLSPFLISSPLAVAEGLPAQRWAWPPWAAQEGSEQHAGQASEPMIPQKCHHLVT